MKHVLLSFIAFDLAAGGLIVLAGLYILRIRQIRQQFQIRLEERISERTRIAREFHDSMLQGFQGLIFRLQAVRDLLPERPGEAIEALDAALERADQAIAEGRAAVQGLRATPLVGSQLIDALTSLTEELMTTAQGAQPRCRVLLEGKSVPLDPFCRDEIYGVAREALRNAFRHSRADNIEAELCFERRRLRLRVRDDGVGIEPETLARGGRQDHWGLLGMRERVRKLGGGLDIWSEQGAGTEVSLFVPAVVAYSRPVKPRLCRLLS